MVEIYENNEIKYVQVNYPNMYETRSLLKEIKGNRSFRELSKECGIAPATLCRISKGNKVLKPDTIRKLSLCSKDPKNMEIQLFRACGFVKPGEKQCTPYSDPLQTATTKQRHDMFNNILMYLFEQGYEIRKTTDEKRIKYDYFGVRVFEYPGMSVFLPEQNLDWIFIPISYTPEGKDEKSEIEAFIGLVIKKFAILFLMEREFPETFQNKKFTFCLSDRMYYIYLSCFLARTKLLHFTTMIIENHSVEENDFSSINQAAFDEFDRLNITIEYT